MIGNFPAVFNFNRLFLKLNRFIVTNCRLSPIMGYTCIQLIDHSEQNWKGLCRCIKNQENLLVNLYVDLGIKTSGISTPTLKIEVTIVMLCVC